jgi:hypothetical protein
MAVGDLVRQKIKRIILLGMGSFAVLYILVVLPNLKDGRKMIHEEDMRILRQAMHAYMVDHGKPPAKLHDLVTEGYLKSIPGDPLLPNLREMDPVLLNDYLSGK